MLKRWDIRDDGYIFWGYEAYKGRRREKWLSPGVALKKHQYMREKSRQYYRRDASPESRAKVAAAAFQYRRRSPTTFLLTYARRRARDLGVPFEITAQDIPIPPVCPFLGIPIAVGDGDGSPSIDRIDPTGGYVPGNVHVISLRANRLKSRFSLAELELLVKGWRALERRRARRSS